MLQNIYVIDCTKKMIGYIVYYRTWWNIIASRPKLPEQNQSSKILTC